MIKFLYKSFSQINLNDSFFDSLRNDYQEFNNWFSKKSLAHENAFVLYNDESKIIAFLYLKSENETIPLTNSNLPIGNRIKIGTFKIDNTIRNLRLGEGMLGIALWKWQKDDSIEIYTTVFEKHNELINLLERFGFLNVGVNSRGERIYLKTKKKIDFSEAYKSFPFIGKSVFQNCRLIPIEQEYHDQLFPYSELANNKYDVESITAGNGITKIYIATPSSTLDFHKGDQAFIYRKSNIPPKKYKSVITSFCTISKIIQIKINWKILKTFKDFLNIVGNKTVYPKEELEEIFKSQKNIILIELIYNGYFGAGNNVNWDTLVTNNLWWEDYPYLFKYDLNQFIEILKLGKVNINQIIYEK